MKANLSVIHVVFALCVTTNCLAADPTPRPQTRNYQTPGNLESKHDIACVGAENLASKFTPADLYKAVAVCAKQGKAKEGAVIFALAGAYGRFDTLRVSDKSAHQAITVLKMQALGGMPPDQEKAFKDGLSKTLGNPEGIAATCKEIIRIGPPGYFPRYMIQHGMGAFANPRTDDGLVKNFNASAAWKQSLDTYLHCPNL